MKRSLKLFVWEEVLCDYTCGIMFAVARNVAEARAQLLAEDSYIPAYDLEKEPQVIDSPCAFAVWGGG